MPQDTGSGGAGALTPLEIGRICASIAWGYKSKHDKSFTQFLDTAIAICLAESGGRPGATNQNSNGTSDWGLWQINDVHKKTFDHDFHGYTNLWGQRFDPVPNSLMAKNIWSAAGDSFSPWSTYKNGAYKKFTGHGTAVHKELVAKGWTELPLGDVTIPGLKSTVDGIDKGIADATGSALVSQALSFLRDGAVAVGVFILGALLIILGIWFVVSQTKAGKSAMHAAKDAAKVAAL